MNINKKNKDRYVVEINDWGCGTLIKDTLTGKEIDAPAEETVNLCIKEMNRLSLEIESLRKAGDAMALCIIEFRCGKYGNALDKVGGFYVWQDWLAAKEGKPSV